VTSRLGDFCVSLFPDQQLNVHTQLEDILRNAATTSSVRRVVLSDTMSDYVFPPKPNDTPSEFLFLSELRDTTSYCPFHLKLVGCRHGSEPRNLLPGAGLLNFPTTNHTTNLFLLPSPLIYATSDHLFLLDGIACLRYSSHRNLLSAHPLPSTQRDWHFYLPTDQTFRAVPTEARNNLHGLLFL
jgi:hypothetical protein